MSFIASDHNALSDHASDIQKTHQDFLNRVEDIKRTVAPVVADMRGFFAQEYDATQARWNAAAADLSSILSDLGTKVQQGADEFHDLDRSLGSNISGHH